MKIIAGLGNPGKEYENTKHNVGFLTIDILAEKYDIKVNKIKFKGLIGEGMIGTEKVILVKPQTYMNLSGQCIREIVAFYKLDMEDLVVIYDDIDLPMGNLRIRKKGSAGTHNGMRSIIYDLQDDGFPRVRVGIGGERKGDLANYVISGFSGDDRKLIEEAIVKAADAVTCLVEDGIDRAMVDYNTKKPKVKKQKQEPDTEKPEEEKEGDMNPSGIRNLIALLCEENGQLGIRLASGITEGQTAYAAAEAAAASGRQILIVTASYDRAKRMEEYISFSEGAFGADRSAKIYLLPDEERSLFSYDAKSRVLSHKRIEGLSAALSGTPGIFIIPAMGACRGMCQRSRFADERLTVNLGDDIDFDDIRSRLTEMGYERVEMTEVKGQYSIRGEIIDIFPPDMDDPVRIDLFDTEINDLKLFDPMTQRSMEALKSVTIVPAVVPDAGSADKAGFFWDYMNDDAMIFADDWDRICEQRELADRDWTAGAASAVDSGDAADNMRPAEIFADINDMVRAMTQRTSLITMPFKKTPMHVEKLIGNHSINCMDAPVFNGRMDNYGKELRRLIKEGYEVHVACATPERKKNLREFADRDEIEGTVNYDEGFMPNGFYFTADLIAYISDNDIFKTSKKRRRKKKSSNGKQIKAFTDLKKGDYVVHENHGIGRFIGIEPLVVEGIRKDYMTIQYAGKDVLYVPVEQMDLIQTYIGSGGAAPEDKQAEQRRLEEDEGESKGRYRKYGGRARKAVSGADDGGRVFVQSGYSVAETV